MSDIKRTLLMLNSTVTPMVDVARADPEVRLNDYISAVRQWWHAFESSPVDILFCENSGHDLTRLRALITQLNAVHRIQIFQYLGDKARIAELGKGVGVTEMFDECCRARVTDGYHYLIIATGRLFVSNAKKLLEQACAADADWAISLRSILDFADSRFFIVKTGMFHTYLFNLGDQINDRLNVFLEHVLVRQLFRSIADGKKWTQFEVLPRYVGVGGTDGKRHSSILGSLRYALKQGLHRFGIKYATYWFI
jgi:hypothetical protein